MSETSDGRRGAEEDDHEHAANLERCGESGSPLVVRSVSPFLRGGLREDTAQELLERASDWRCLRTTELSMWNRNRRARSIGEGGPKATRPKELSTASAGTIATVAQWIKWLTVRILTLGSGVPTR